MMRRALVYTRVSTKGQEDGTSLESQESACIAYADTHGYSVTRVTREIYSGAEWERPGLSNDLIDIRAKRFDAVICYAVDRLSREMGQLAYIALECEKADCALLFVTEDLDQSPTGKLLRSVLSFVAEVEREKIRERSVRGKRSRALAGKLHNAGPELYGYRREKNDTNTLRHAHEPEAQVVRDIFGMVIEGISIRGIAKTLNRQGIPAPGSRREYRDGRSPRWGQSGIRRIIKHEAYKGEAVAWKWARRKRKLIERPTGERINLPVGLVPPIITVDVWELAQERLATNTGERVRNETRPYLLRGHILCATCGTRMYTDRRTYRCSSRDRRTGKCDGLPVNASRCDEWAWNTTAHVIAHRDEIEKQFKKRCDRDSDSQLKATLTVRRKELAKLERGQERLVRRLREASKSLSKLIEAELERLEQEKARLEKNIAELEGRTNRHYDKMALNRKQYTVPQKLEGADFEHRRLTLFAYQAAIYASGKSLRMELRIENRVVSLSYSDSAQNAYVVDGYRQAA